MGLYYLFCSVLFLRTCLIYSKIGLKLLCSQWPQSFDLLASSCRMLELQVCTPISVYVVLETDPLTIHSRKSLWKQSCILSLNYSVFLENFRGDYDINDLCLRKTVLHSTCCYLNFKFWTKSCRCWNLESHVDTVIIQRPYVPKYILFSLFSLTTPQGTRRKQSQCMSQ